MIIMIMIMITTTTTTTLTTTTMMMIKDFKRGAAEPPEGGTAVKWGKKQWMA